jgi:hypothetical protein
MYFTLLTIFMMNQAELLETEVDMKAELVVSQKL